MLRQNDHSLIEEEVTDDAEKRTGQNAVETAGERPGNLSDLFVHENQIVVSENEDGRKPNPRMQTLFFRLAIENRLRFESFAIHGLSKEA
jgi:hypothetical protein